MIAAGDVETYEKKGEIYEPVLNAQKFLQGCIINEKTKKPHIFNNKKAMWQYILEKGQAQAKRKKTYNIYFHNAQYDFYSIADLTDKNLQFYSNKPFIVTYNINGHQAIKFLDTLSIYRMPLKQVGEMIGYPKGELPTQNIKIPDIQTRIVT